MIADRLGEDFMIGTRLSHYQILERLGAGGMGVVYRARDEHLQRDVAVKVLPAGALADDAARKQFRKEALALSKLNHPNICTIFDFDTQDGVDFLVVELVEGVTLSERISRGPISEAEIADLGLQLAEGLSAAHKREVLHRDIKPANLRITPEGRLKILDFGLAKLVRAVGEHSATETVTGVAAGTLPYMSPEQLRGERLDVRSDVHAAGAVLYEMACGRRAFPQESQSAVIGAILGQPPVAPRELNSGISTNLEQIILRCLEKDRGLRYASARDLGADLREVGSPSGRRIGGRRRRALPAAPAIAGAALVALAALGVGLDLGGLRGRIFGGSGPTIPSLAVLPLVNLSGDLSQEYFSDGMTDELITRLTQVSALKVISRSSVMQYKGVKKPLSKIARELGVKAVVEGSVLRSGDRVRISAQLIDVSTNRNIWAESYERSLGNVLGLQSEVARAIVENVRVRITPEERARLASAPPVNPEAHEAYLRGRADYNQSSEEGFRRALEQFQRAVAIDPGYAAAYAGLADAYAGMSERYLPADHVMPRARAAASKALDLDPQLASAHASRAAVKAFYEWDWSGAEQDLKHALELNSGDAMAHQIYGGLLVIFGRFREAEIEIARALEIDPLNRELAMMSLWPLFEGRQFDRAIAAAERLIQADPSAWASHMIFGQALLFRGMHARAIAEIRRAAELEPKAVGSVGWLAYAYARSGDRAKARDLFDRLRKGYKSPGSYVEPYILALVLVGLGEKDEALDWLEQALKVRSGELVFLNVDPTMDPLRSEPRFQAIIERMGFPDPRTGRPM